MVVSLHGRDRQALFAALSRHDTVAVYTDPVNTPTWIGSELVARGQTGWRMLGSGGPGGHLGSEFPSAHRKKPSVGYFQNSIC